MPINVLCVDANELKIADGREVNGVRLPADQFRETARMAMGSTKPRPEGLAAVGSGIQVPNAGSIHYPVNVYRVIPSTTTQYMYLFSKPWEVPTCSAR